LAGRTPLQLNSDEKIIVTERGLDDWIAQLYGFTVDTIPRLRPVGMPEPVYSHLRKYVNYRRQSKEEIAEEKKKMLNSPTSSMVDLI